MRGKRVLFIGLLTGLLIALVFLGVSCKTTSPSSAKQKKKPSVSEEEAKKVKDELALEVISVTPNGAGFMEFYGQVTNVGNKTISRVEILIVSTVEQKTGETRPVGVIGQGWVENLQPDKTGDFTVSTGLEPQDLPPYEVRLGRIEL